MVTFETQSSYCRMGWGKKLLGILSASAKTIKAKCGKQRHETKSLSAVRKYFLTLQLLALFYGADHVTHTCPHTINAPFTPPYPTTPQPPPLPLLRLETWSQINQSGTAASSGTDSYLRVLLLLSNTQATHKDRVDSPKFQFAHCPVSFL